MNISKDELKSLGLTMTAFAASFLLKKMLEQGYKQIYEEEPPSAVKDQPISWGKLAAWTAISGLTATALKIMITRYGAQKIEGID